MEVEVAEMCPYATGYAEYPGLVRGKRTYSLLTRKAIVQIEVDRQISAAQAAHRV